LTASNRLNQAGNLTLDLLLSLSKMLKLSVKFLESLSKSLFHPCDGVINNFGTQHRLGEFA
jgi:hypothetical protein